MTNVTSVPSILNSIPTSLFNQSTMAEKHKIHNDRALATMLRPFDRQSRFQDGYGDFCFAPKRLKCAACSVARLHLWNLQALDAENTIPKNFVEENDEIDSYARTHASTG